MVNSSPTDLRQYPTMLGHGIWAVPARQQHDSDPFERIGDRRVVIEIALHYLNIFRGRKYGRVSDKGADFAAGHSKGIQRRASDLACRRSNRS